MDRADKVVSKNLSDYIGKNGQLREREREYAPAEDLISVCTCILPSILVAFPIWTCASQVFREFPKCPLYTREVRENVTFGARGGQFGAEMPTWHPLGWQAHTCHLAKSRPLLSTRDGVHRWVTSPMR